ncbi:MAG: PilZ domain-containing protein [Candidatus Omnitrophota bacterium]
MQDKERRRFKRIKRNLFVQCRPFDTTAIWSSVIIKDISESGISFLADKEFMVGETLEIKLVTFIKKEPLALIGEVVARDKNVIGKKWLTRIAISRMSEEDKPVMHEYIQIFLKAADNTPQDG